MLHKLVGAGIVGGEEGNADAARRVDLPLAQREWLVQHVEDAPGQGGRFLGTFGVNLYYRELVSPQTGHEIGAANTGAEPVGDDFEKQISRGMPKAVVDDLEAIEVEQQEGQHPVPSSRLFQ